MTAERGIASRVDSSAQTRGFLFADIRGYTEYLERHGASATAELLARYRQIVRGAIAEHQGAEIRTEGDSFYVVLPSASTAVRCALSIVRSVEDENAREPAHAIRVGVGVHAGEAIDTDEGLVGSAVNIAARLSAIARPGEGLVSETVRTLTRSVIAARFVPRGRHRLKGVAEPQEVFAAMASNTPVAPARFRRLRYSIAVSLGIVGVALVVGLIYIALPVGLAPTPAPTATAGAAAATSSGTPSASLATPTASASVTPPFGTPGPSVIRLPTQGGGDPGGGVQALSPGSYRFNSFRPILVFAIDPRWTDRAWHPLLSLSDRALLVLTKAGYNCCGYPLLEGMDPGLMLMQFTRIQTVLTNPCDPGDSGSTELLNGRPRDLIDWLSQHRFLAATGPQQVTVGGWTGLSVDVTVKGDPGKFCAGLAAPHQGQVYLFRTADSEIPGSLFTLRDGEEARFTVVDVGEDSPLVLISWSAVSDFLSRVTWSAELVNTITPGQ
jgi:class 3 adenylate cyclase